MDHIFLVVQRPSYENNISFQIPQNARKKFLIFKKFPMDVGSLSLSFAGSYQTLTLLLSFILRLT